MKLAFQVILCNVVISLEAMIFLIGNHVYTEINVTCIKWLIFLLQQFQVFS